MRPCLDFRMPTLANKNAFLLPLEEITAKSKVGLKQFETHPPTSLKEVRNLLTAEIKSVQKKLNRLERSYYGVGKTLSHEVKRVATPIKILIRMLGYFELPSTKSIEAAIKNGSDPKRYKGDPENVALLKEVFAKVQTFVPAKFKEVAETCEKMLEVMEKYLISFYDPESEIEVETASHFETQIRSWRKTIRENLVNIHSLIMKFKGRGIHYSMFSSPVATFCQRNECELVPFLLLFAEACTNIRTALSIITQWIKCDENYAVFLQNDVRDLEHQKEEHVKAMREAREKYHSATFKVNQAEVEYTKLLADFENIKEKGAANEIEEMFLISRLNELESDMEFKEGRREELKRKADEIDPDALVITLDNLNEEIRFLKDKLPGIRRQLATAKHRREWMCEKHLQVEKAETEIVQLQSDVREAENTKKQREAEFETIDNTLDLARKLLLLKNSSDSVEKIFYGIPITARNTRMKLPNISNGTEGALDKACQKVIRHIDQDWMQLYRNLPFFPKRGAHTIESDISSIAAEGARGPKQDVIQVALNRWRRHHTRARVDDLKQGLKAIKRSDVLKEVETTMNPTPEKVEEQEYFPPELDPDLKPFYRDVVKLDQLIAAKKIQIVQLAEED